jgi:hypothetical protein
VAEIQRYMRENGHPPSSNWVYRRTRELLPTGGFNRDKVRRALAAAGIPEPSGASLGRQLAEEA